MRGELDVAGWAPAKTETQEARLDRRGLVLHSTAGGAVNPVLYNLARAYITPVAALHRAAARVAPRDDPRIPTCRAAHQGRAEPGRARSQRGARQIAGGARAGVRRRQGERVWSRPHARAAGARRSRRSGTARARSGDLPARTRLAQAHPVARR